MIRQSPTGAWRNIMGLILLMELTFPKYRVNVRGNSEILYSIIIKYSLSFFIIIYFYLVVWSCLDYKLKGYVLTWSAQSDYPLHAALMPLPWWLARESPRSPSEKQSRTQSFFASVMFRVKYCGQFLSFESVSECGEIERIKDCAKGVYDNADLIYLWIFGADIIVIIYV